MIFGPDVSSLFLSICLIACPAVAFCIKIFLKVYNVEPPGNAHWYPVLFGGLSLTFLVSFGWIGLDWTYVFVRFYIGWRGERNIPYKGVETSP